MGMNLFRLQYIKLSLDAIEDKLTNNERDMRDAYANLHDIKMTVDHLKKYIEFLIEHYDVPKVTCKTS